MIDKLEYLSAAELGREVNAHHLSPIDVVEYFIKRIEERNPSINAVVYTKFDEAREEARNLQKRLDAGENCGPFAGVPFILKEFLPSKKGWKSWHGGVKCLEIEDPYDSRFTESMEKLGGIAIGKANAPAYGFRGTTDNKMFGATSTPFAPGYNSGGSSGGSAAAVADGLALVGEGGDAGGSIRLPASWCNLVGFKAGVGTIPSVCRPDAWSATHPLCFAGGLVKTVEDAAILLTAMQDCNPRDPYNHHDIIDYVNYITTHNIKGMKIAFTKDFGLFEVDERVAELIACTAKRFEEAGAIVEEVTFNFKHNANELAEQWCKGITIDCALDLNHAKEQGKDYLATNAQDFPEEFIYWKNECDKMGIEDMYKFNLARTDVLDNFEDIFEQYDLILSPVACCLPVKNRTDRNTKGPETINGKKVESLIGWCETFLCNFTGNPACSVPAGLIDGFPTGIQIIGKRYHDEEVLLAAYEFEKIQPWWDNFEIPLTRKLK